MQLNLKNPIIFFDIETTGLNIAKDRIVEISAVKVFPNGKEEIKTRRINPTIPISAEAKAVHGISDEDVKDCPKFCEIAKSLAQWMTGCDIAGYNSNKFDIPLLSEEFLRSNINFDFRKRHLVDVQAIFKKMEPRTLTAAYKFFCGKNLEDAHSAEADTLATYEVLKAQLDKYSDTLKNDISMLSEFSVQRPSVDYAGRIGYNDKKEPIFNFGKHKGKRVVDVLKNEPSYYSWMMQGDFTLDTKKVLTDIKLNMSR
jgi:DNA polymerase-3 subunit epsilon